MAELLQELRQAFEDAGRAENAGPMQAYMKDVAPFFGIKKPELKVIERSIFAATKSLPFAEVEAITRALCTEQERELHYLAGDWLRHRRKDWTLDTIALIEYLLVTKPWWDTVDLLAVHCLGEWVRLYPKEGLKVIRRYIKSGNLWLERAAIIHQLGYKDETNTDLLEAAILPHLRSKEFFHQKAIGWALRQYAKTDAEWVRRFVAGHELMPLSRREAMKRF